MIRLCSHFFPVIIALSINSSLINAHAIEKKDDDNISVCDEEDFEASLASEEVRLLDFISREKNLTLLHPVNIMTSAQTILAMIHSQGITETTLRGLGKVKVYNLFSGGGAIAGKRRIIGQLPGIHEVVTSIRDQAAGDDTGRSVPLLVGTHGTGKSEFKTVIANALKNLSMSDSRFFYYEIAWHVDLLKNIPDLKMPMSAVTVKEFISPMHSSPVALLPEVYQKKLAILAQKTASDLTKSDAKITMPKLDPYSTDIKNKIMQHFSMSNSDFVKDTLSKLEIKTTDVEINEKGHVTQNRKLQSSDWVIIFDYFMTCKRLVMGSDGTVPLIEAQGDDVNYNELIGGDSPLFKSFPGSPPVWNFLLNGVIPKANRNLVFFDEIFRSPYEFRNFLLGVFQERQLSIIGDVRAPLDAVILAGTNSSNLAQALADPKSAAQVNRMKQIPFEWSLYPQDIARVLFYMNSNSLYMRKLAAGNTSVDDFETTAPFVPLELDSVFPMPHKDPIKTTDGRYAIQYGSQEDARSVHISPHAVNLMTDTIALTRMSFANEKPQSLKKAVAVMAEPVFRNPLKRLSFYKNTGLFSPAVASEIIELSQLTKEGSFGISTRVAGRWFAKAISLAIDSPSHTLTPKTVKQAFQMMKASSQLEASSDAEALKWETLFDLIVTGVTIPALESDLNSAFSDSDRAAEIYEETICEVLAVGGGDNSYEIEGQSRIVDRKRLTKINDYYLKEVGFELAAAQITSLIAMRNDRSNQHETETKDPHLMKAINAYLADHTEGLTLSTVLRAALKATNSNPEIAKVTKTMETKMINELGYNIQSIKDAWELIRQYQDMQENQKSGV